MPDEALTPFRHTVSEAYDSAVKATTENNTTSVTTHFKKLTTGNNVFIHSFII